MSATSEFVNETQMEEKPLDFWSEYPCLYDVDCATFKDRGKREDAILEMGMKILAF